MTTYPLCVFLESRDHGRLSTDHPFYRLVEEVLQNIAQSPLVMRYMARNTLKHEKSPDEDAEKRRIEEIIHYLQNVCPTVSGSDSPRMDSAFVQMRAYSGCCKNPRSRKDARKNVYIQKRLVDAWMKACEKSGWELSPSDDRGKYFLLTFFMKLCVLRGLTAAIELTFTSDSDIYRTHPSHNGLVPVDSACTFEHFLTQWSDSWLVFETDCSSHAPNKAHLRYNKLHSIVFTSTSHHVEIKSNPGASQVNLQHLAAGVWTSFPKVTVMPYNALHPRCIRMWNSLPADDAKPRNIEKTPRKSDRGFWKDLCVFDQWKEKAVNHVTEE